VHQAHDPILETKPLEQQTREGGNNKNDSSWFTSTAETETPLTYGCGTLDLWQIVAQLLTFLLFFPHALRLGGYWARIPIEQFADGADGFQGWGTGNAPNNHTCEGGAPPQPPATFC
jgi:hypothetical protein